MDPVTNRVRQLIAYHENAAATLRHTLKLITHAARPPRATRAGRPPAAAKALKMDAARRRGTPTKAQSNTNAAAAERRAHSAELLQKFDPEKPRTLKDLALTNGHSRIRIGPYVNAGYLRAKGPGYVRTAKPFTA